MMASQKGIGFPRVVLGVWTAVVGLVAPTVAADVSSDAYVPQSPVAQWDGVDNTLANGVRSHDAAAKTWCDLTGNGNHVPLPSFVAVEGNAMLSKVVSGCANATQINASKTALTPKLAKINGLSTPGPAGNAYTVEIVMQRVAWQYKDNYNNLQSPFSSCRGYFGYRYADNNGFCVMTPETTEKLHLMNFKPSGVKAADVHTATLVYNTGASQLFLDAAQYAISYNTDSYTSAWATNFTFFGNIRADVRIHAIRVYSRALAANEIAHNALVDKIRFLGADVPLAVRDVPSTVFDGVHPCEPEPVVVNALTGETLKKGTDYEVAYADNDHLGFATLTVTGKGDWAGRTVTQQFLVDTGKYHFVDFIASSGTQYIDTGYLPGPSTRMEAEIMFTGAINRALGGDAFFGCAEGNLEFSANFGGASGQETKIYSWLDKAYTKGGAISAFTLKDGIGTILPFGINAASGVCVAGRAGIKGPATQTAHAQNPLALFGTVTTTGQMRPFTYYGMRVYRWKIWNGADLVRDFVPCRRVYDGSAGLLDRVSGRFYGNAGTGAFSAGEDASLDCSGYTRLEYLQSSGTPVVDVDPLPQPTTQLLMDYSLQGTCNRSRGSANLFGSAEPDGVNIFSANFGGSQGQETQVFMWLDKTYAAGGGKTYKLDINSLPLRQRLEVRAATGAVTNGTSTTWAAVKKVAHTNHTMAVFGSHAANGSYVAHGYYDMRLYGLKLWDGSTLVRDLVPCLRSTDSKPGLLDRVSGRFFVNCGTGEFTYATVDDRPVLPAAYQRLDGLVATGCQAVATGIYANDRTLVSLRAVPYNVGDANNRRLFSARGNVAYGAVTKDQLRYELFPTNSKWACSCADGTVGETTGGPSITAGWSYCLSLDSGRGMLMASGTRIGSVAGTRTKTSPGEIVLLSGGVDKPHWKGVFKEVFIFTNDAIARALAPCVRRADGAVGFYDSVSAAFLPSASDAPCLAGIGAPSGVPRFQGTLNTTLLTTGAHYQNLTNFSVSVWTKDPDVQTDKTDYAGIVSMGALANTPGFCCFVNNYDRSNRRISFQTRSAENTTSSLDFPLAKMRPGRWHQIVFTYDFEGGRSCLYLDGRLMDSKTDQAALVNPAMSRLYSGSCLTVGNRSQDPTFPLRGQLAQLSIWNRALSSREVWRLGSKPPTGDEAGLLGYWPLDAGMNGLFDHVANGCPQHSFKISSAFDTAFVEDPVNWLLFGTCIIVR